jgi:hypothetical protein
LNQAAAQAQSVQGPPSALVRALRQLLRPLVRLLLARQVTFPFLSGLLKEVYVDVAMNDFPLQGKAQTGSRISLLTGIHRKDVKRLRGLPQEETATPANVSLGAQIVARWTGAAEFLDGDGRPRSLPRQAPPEGGPSFESLVAGVSRDIRARAVLDEWLRLGVARLDDEDRVVLNAEAFIPSKGFDEKCFYFGRNLRHHVAAGVHNLLGDLPPFVDRSVYYDGLTEESVRELMKLAEKTGMEALQAVNRRAMELQKRDRERVAADRQLNFGVYIHQEREFAETPGDADA